MEDSTALVPGPTYEEHSDADRTKGPAAEKAAASPLQGSAVNLPSFDHPTEIKADPEAHPLAAAEIEMLLSVSDTPSRRNTRGMSAAAAHQVALLHPPVLDPAASDPLSPSQQHQLKRKAAITTNQLTSKSASTSSSPPSPHLLALALLAASAKGFEEGMLLDMDEEELEEVKAVGWEGGNKRRGFGEEHTHTPHPKRVRTGPVPMPGTPAVGSVLFRVDERDGNSPRALVFSRSFAHAVWFDGSQDPPQALSPRLAAMEGDPLDAICMGIVKLVDGGLVPATLRELRAHFSLVFNSPVDLATPTLHLTRGSPVPAVYISITCENTIGHFTYPSSADKTCEQGLETAAPVVLYENESGLLVETTPSQFETQQANSSAKRWRGSFKAMGFSKMMRALTCAPVNIHDVSWVIRDLVGSNRQLGKPPNILTALAGVAMNPEPSSDDCLDADPRAFDPNDIVKIGHAHAGRESEAENAKHSKTQTGNTLTGDVDHRGPGHAFVKPLHAAQLEGLDSGHTVDSDEATAVYGASLLSGLSQRRQQAQPAGTASLASLAQQQYNNHCHPLHNASQGAAATGGTDMKSVTGVVSPSTQAVDVKNGGNAKRAGLGSGDGILSTAELQAIAAVCSCLTGPALSFAVQGIMAHVAIHHPNGSSSSSSSGIGGVVGISAPMQPPLHPSAQIAAVAAIADIKADSQVLPDLQAILNKISGDVAASNGAPALNFPLLPAVETNVHSSGIHTSSASHAAIAASIAVSTAAAAAASKRCETASGPTLCDDPVFNGMPVTSLMMQSNRT